MRKAVWGTGLYASEFTYAVKRENFDFYIDNDIKKRGTYFLGKQVLYPDDINDWNDLYIYIPYNFYDDIVKQLRKYGLNDETRYQKYYEINKLDVSECEKDLNRALEQVRQKAGQVTGWCFFWGRAWAFEDKGYREYIQSWSRNSPSLRIALISEAVWYSQEETEIVMDLPAIVTPGLFDDNIYVEGARLESREDAFLKEKKYAGYAVQGLKIKFPELTEESACYMVYHMYQYIMQLLDRLRPELIIVYPLLMLQHLILEEVCSEKKIPLISTHQGVLPGTIAFDVGGEMGKSLPAQYAEKFLNLPINAEDLEYAKKVWDYLYESKLNRKIQHKNDCIGYVMKNINKNWPIVFYAGQYDMNSNMVPYTEDTKKYHSPVFKTSIEAGVYLAELCRRNDWNFIYKPHPMNTKSESKDQLPDNTIYVEYGNINDLIDVSDVIVTILSQTNYISLIRHKPVVMLGFNQTKGKGCTYEAFEKARIENVIKAALENGFTKEQEYAFVVHIAQLLKYYLYDDGKERKIRYGQTVPQSIEEFYKLKKILKESDGDQHVL